MAKNDLTVVIRLEGGKSSLAFDGDRPFIGTEQRGKDVATFLKSLNPECEYTIASVNVSKWRAKESGRYTLKNAMDPTHPDRSK